MKWVNPPVAFMLHAGIGLLLDAGVQIATPAPGRSVARRARGYPGLLARELIGRRSYKSDTSAMQTPARRERARSSCCAASKRARAGSASRLRSTRRSATR